MQEYLELYGWHFSPKLCEWAVKRMKRRVSGGGVEPVTMMNKDKAEEMLKAYGIDCSNFIGYDHVYVLNMAKSDFYGSSIADEAKLARYVCDYLNDPDGYDEIALTRFYADAIGKGEIIPWAECI